MTKTTAAAAAAAGDPGRSKGGVLAPGGMLGSAEANANGNNYHHSYDNKNDCGSSHAINRIDSSNEKDTTCSSSHTTRTRKSNDDSCNDAGSLSVAAAASQGANYDALSRTER
mmetsp:Transcript_38958/g.63413  ORF Transcript_38958/g.63413 Transcript_38958/m.63413 type:complete len:113 (-) Transcript_38958:225-563(-)